jgi:hypothetical protein
VCIGEKILNNEECFILKLEAGAATLRARSAPAFDIIHHVHGVGLLQPASGHGIATMCHLV